MGMAVQRLILLGLLALLLSGCVKRNTAQVASGGPRVVLVRTDLGLADGEFVRDANTALTTLEQQGKVQFQAVGELPVALQDEPEGQDIGLPVPQSKKAGEMTQGEAAALVGQAPASDILVIASGPLLASALDAVASGKVSTKCILLLDEQGMGPVPVKPLVPVYRLHYDIKHIAFLLGVAAAQSSTLAHFGVLYSSDDPQGAEFAKAVAAGAKYLSNGAWTEAVPVQTGPLGYVTPDLFQQGFQALRKQGGPNFKPDHFILDLGRSTPTIMDALSKKPLNAYLLGAYADYTHVRPAHIVGCALKRPDLALLALFSKLDAAQFAANPAQTLAGLADKDGAISVGLKDAAIGFTDFTLYSRYKNDGADIKAVVDQTEAQMKTGELQAQY